jgi:hypothetical protein
MVVVGGVKIMMVFFIALGLGRLQSPVETASPVVTVTFQDLGVASEVHVVSSKEQFMHRNLLFYFFSIL